MKLVRVIVGFVFNVVGGVLLVMGLLAVWFDQTSARSISVTHGPAILLGAFVILTGELIHPKRANKSN